MRPSLILLFLLEPLTLCMGRLSAVAHAGDFCTLPRDAGSCTESLRRFFFNATSWKCEPFIFRGCQGNLNRFITKKECEHSCGMIDICRLPPEPGPRDLSVRSWFYNWQAQTCQRFTYGGCLGNKNRFQTPKACKRQCARP